MRREGASITFTVYFDGQFWVGIVERLEEGRLSAARVVFGAEPSDEEVFQFVLDRWGTLRFSPEVEAERRREPGNPKRRQREAAKAAAKAAPSTKAQQAIARCASRARRRPGRGAPPRRGRPHRASAPCAQRSARRSTAGIDRVPDIHCAQVGASGIYHAACHAFVFDGEAVDDILESLFKGAFFTLQALHFLRTETYPRTKAELADMVSRAR